VPSELSPPRIVLVEPSGALNLGAIARAMKNMALHELVLVNPHCDPHAPAAQRMAVHASDILAQARQATSLPQALQGCQRAIATTARPRQFHAPLESPREALPWLLEAPSALVFGPEERGLSNAELNCAQRFVAIPSSPDYPSLNLAAAVTVCAYELYQARRSPAPAARDAIPAPQGEAAPLEELEAYYQHLESVLLQIGHLAPHTAPARMLKLRRLYNRARLTREELALLRGTLRQTEWAISQPPSAGSGPSS